MRMEPVLKVEYSTIDIKEEPKNVPVPSIFVTTQTQQLKRENTDSNDYTANKHKFEQVSGNNEDQAMQSPSPHTRNKHFSCDVCKKEYTQKNHLTTHLLTHTAELEKDGRSDHDDDRRETAGVQKKRKGDSSKWKRNVRKIQRVKGEAYIGTRGKEMPGRPLLPVPCEGRCRHKCVELVNEDNRIAIYTAFRGMESISNQRQFIANHVEKKVKNRTTRNLDSSRRMYTYVYTFTVGNEKKRVCRDFFMATLNITDAFMRNSVAKCKNGIAEPDKRGQHAPHNKLKEEEEQRVRHHILSFPSVESHDTTKKYLYSPLNVSIMHREFKEKCEKQNMPTVSLIKYRQIFNEYNLGFFTPKKDQCGNCLTGEQNDLDVRKSTNSNEDKIKAQDDAGI